MPVGPDNFARELADIAVRYGPDGLNDRKRVTALLADRLPDAARDVRLVGVAIDNGAVVALRATHPDGVGVEIDRLAARIEGHIGTPRALSIPMLRALAYGLGRGALPSAYAGVAPEVSTVAAPRPVEPPTRLVAPRPVAPPPVAAPPVAVPSPAGGSTRGLTMIVAYWFVAQIYWLWAGFRYVGEIVGVVSNDADIIDLVIVVAPAVALLLGLVAAAAFWRRHRAFAVLLTAWLLLGALALGYMLVFMVGNDHIGLSEWEQWLPGVVAIVAALVFVPHVWRSPAIRRMFAR